MALDRDDRALAHMDHEHLRGCQLVPALLRTEPEGVVQPGQHGAVGAEHGSLVPVENLVDRLRDAPLGRGLLGEAAPGLGLPAGGLGRGLIDPPPDAVRVDSGSAGRQGERDPGRARGLAVVRADGRDQVRQARRRSEDGASQ